MLHSNIFFPICEQQQPVIILQDGCVTLFVCVTAGTLLVRKRSNRENTISVFLFYSARMKGSVASWNAEASTFKAEAEFLRTG